MLEITADDGAKRRADIPLHDKENEVSFTLSEYDRRVEVVIRNQANGESVLSKLALL